MGRNRKKPVKSTKIKRFRKWDSQSKGKLNTGHMEAQPVPSIPPRDAMSALWGGEFKQCIELFSRRKVEGGQWGTLWLLWRQSTYIFMQEDFIRQTRSFSIFFGSEQRALSYVENIPWSQFMSMENVRTANDRVVQSPGLWRIGRHRTEV